MTRTYWKIQESTDSGKTWEQRYTLTQYDSFEKAEKSKNYLTEVLSFKKQIYRVVRTEETIKEFLDEGEEYEVTCSSKYHYSSSWDKSDSVKFYSKSEAEDYIKKMERLNPSWSDTVYRYELKKLK